VRGMSRTLWPGRGSAKGSATFSSVTAAAVPSVNLGPPVGLPPDVLQHILTFVDGRGLAVCEQVCKGMRSTASDKQLYVAVALLRAAVCHTATLPVVPVCSTTPMHSPRHHIHALESTYSLCPIHVTGGAVPFTGTLPSPRANGERTLLCPPPPPPHTHGDPPPLGSTGL
jgi:hypothetical protein